METALDILKNDLTQEIEPYRKAMDENSALYFKGGYVCAMDKTIEKIINLKVFEKELLEEISIKFAEFVLNNNHTWTMPKKQLYKEFIKNHL